MISGTIFLCWILNSTLLDNYYLLNKQQVLEKAYRDVNLAITEGSITSDDFSLEFSKTCGIYNLDMIILDADSNYIVTSLNEHESMFLQQQLWKHIFEEENPKDRVINKQSDYIIQTYQDGRTRINYLEMWGVFSNGTIFLMQTPLEGMKDSAKIANRFLAYVGLITTFISAIIMFFVSDKMTRPIMKLAEISNRMASLDFDAKYHGKEKNEIGLLGKHMNTLSDALEKTISELKTANNELQHDIEKREHIDEMRVEFLSNVSHELKTPIALIMGYTEGLKMNIHEDADSKDFYCDVILDEATKMNLLVKKLLSLNELEFGNDILQMSRFNVAELIRSVVQSNELILKQKDIHLNICSEQVVFVWGDEFMVEQVFENYLTNAINHVSGVNQINISIQESPACSNTIRITVFNSGSSIPSDSAAYIWDKFYKVDKARTREYGGSGIGLSIVKVIMDSLHQKFGFENKEAGVEFWFELESK